MLEHFHQKHLLPVIGEVLQSSRYTITDPLLFYRLLEGTLGLYPTDPEFPGVCRWFSVPGLDPVLCPV